MTRCWFCGIYERDTKVRWSGRMEYCCPKCFKIWVDNNVAKLWEKLDAKMKRECPLPDDYKIPGRKR